MDLSLEVQAWLGAGIVIALGLIFAGINQLDRVQIKKYLRKYTPDQIEFLLNMVWDASWKAVDAQLDKYSHLTDAQKQALAMKYVRLLLKFLATGKLEPEANAAYVEYRLLENRTEHRELKKKAA